MQPLKKDVKDFQDGGATFLRTRRREIFPETRNKTRTLCTFEWSGQVFLHVHFKEHNPSKVQMHLITHSTTFIQIYQKFLNKTWNVLQHNTKRWTLGATWWKLCELCADRNSEQSIYKSNIFQSRPSWWIHLRDNLYSQAARNLTQQVHRTTDD